MVVAMIGWAVLFVQDVKIKTCTSSTGKFLMLTMLAQVVRLLGVQ